MAGHGGADRYETRPGIASNWRGHDAVRDRSLSVAVRWFGGYHPAQERPPCADEGLAPRPRQWPSWRRSPSRRSPASTTMARRPAGWARCISPPRARRPCRRSSTAASRCCIPSGSPRRSSPSTRVLKGDPRCVMAHWGIAMSWWGNPFGGFRSPQALDGRPGRHRRRQGQRRRHRSREGVPGRGGYCCSATPRRVDQRTRTVAYEKAMEALAAKYPDDVEARIFYALALGSDGAADRQDLREPAESRGDPRSGVHAAARASRAWPTTSFTASTCRRWRRARSTPRGATRRSRPTRRTRSTCRRTRSRAWASGRSRSTPTSASAAAARKDNAAAEELHALDYQAYAYLQTAQDAAAKRTLDAIARARREDRRRPAPAMPRRRPPATTRWRRFRRATRSSATRGPRRPRSRRARRRSRGPTPSPTSPARSAPREAATSPRRGEDIERLAALRDALADGQRRVLDRAGGDSAARGRRRG